MVHSILSVCLITFLNFEHLKEYLTFRWILLAYTSNTTYPRILKFVDDIALKFIQQFPEETA